jgi:hypothetical protein
VFEHTHTPGTPLITHKFLITGHTQNEGDNVHSIIEKAVKRHLKGGAICEYVPAQYVSIIRGAKKTDYRITLMK